MTTPVWDFVKRYAQSKTARFHMPGHKGHSFIGCEPFDITEIDGADVLYHAHGIIAESEKNAAALFHTQATFYSAEGSTLAIKAMLATVCASKEKAHVLAARNVHKSFLYACALLDVTVSWIDAERPHLCTCILTADALDARIRACKPDAVYITSPDYLGNLADVAALAAVCKKHALPLLVDNAHGAYLAFLSPSLHPIHLGATMTADSAHKTLPVLTGGAYLHIAKDAPKAYAENASRALSLFASTSPSYLVLASLDRANLYLKEEIGPKLAAVHKEAEKLKEDLCALGYSVQKTEPFKLVLDTAAYGYYGEEFALLLRQNGIEIEFSDKEQAVLMLSSETKEEDFLRLREACASIPRRPRKSLPPLPIPRPLFAVSPREAILGAQERIPIASAAGRICASPSVSCPPAVPIVVSGERIMAEHLPLFERYGIEEIDVLK